MRFFIMYVFILAMMVAVTGCSRPSRKNSSGTSDMIQIKGSDTMVNLGQAWAETFMDTNPEISVAVTGGGSGTGITALAQGYADIAESSRSIKDKEVDTAAQNNVKPVEHEVALDALSIIVNPSNPISQITIDQLSDIYTGKITNWKQLNGPDMKIVLLSRDKNSGSHVFFLEQVVRRGNEKGPEEFAAPTLMLPSSEAIARQVETDRGSIGYVGLGYAKAQKHKALSVARTSSGPFVTPEIENAIAGTYSIARPLYWYTNGEPSGNIKRLVDFVLSDQGQSIVASMGFAPIKASE